ncbi:MAG: hypothetical protein R3B72_43665 [Polyangiaceae bacterium]
MDLTIAHGDEQIRFETERITIEPFDLRQPCRYDVVLDRLTHWYHPSREWIKKAVVLNDLYVLNNPWTLQSMEKHTSYCAMMRLGMQVPETWMVPPKSYEPIADLQPTLERYAQMFDLGEVGRALGYPVFMKPYAGGGWVGISKADDEESLKAAYEDSGVKLMHVQRAVADYDLFTRCVGLGPQIRYVEYAPDEPLHDRYSPPQGLITAEDRRLLRAHTLTINSFFGWDFNSAEVLRSPDGYFPIDFANACPDSQVTSLHYHFPWLVKAKIRWAVFCAVTKRRFRHDLGWDRYFAIADDDRPFADKLTDYAAIADEHFETERFVEFCDDHLAALDEVAYEFFATDEAKDIVATKVRALYPEHEVDDFTDLFWSRIQAWREAEGQNTAVIE